MAADDDQAPPWVAQFRVQKDVIRSFSSDPELSLLHLAIIVFLATSKTGETVSRLREEYGLDFGLMSKHLRSLRDGGYVYPIADASDARQRRYWNTIKGSNAAAAHLRRLGHAVEGKDLPHVGRNRMKVRR